MNWRWIALAGSHVLHLVQSWKPVTGGSPRYEALCGGKAGEVIVEPNAEERCLACLRKAVRSIKPWSTP